MPEYDLKPDRGQGETDNDAPPLPFQAKNAAFHRLDIAARGPIGHSTEATRPEAP
jgi:hypothetical protein